MILYFCKFVQPTTILAGIFPSAANCCFVSMYLSLAYCWLVRYSIIHIERCSVLYMMTG